MLLLEIPTGLIPVGHKTVQMEVRGYPAVIRTGVLNLLEPAQLFWLKYIIPSVQLELSFLGDCAESSAGT
jgi:hypothetical protein